MKIALIYDPASRHGSVWSRWLNEDGHTVVGITDQTSTKDIQTAGFDLIIPLITIRDYVEQPNPRMEALRKFEAYGANLLTSSAAIAASSDKLLTYKIWKNHAINQPLTILYDKAQYDRPQNDEEVIVKPRFGHSGNAVFLVKSSDELDAAIKRIDGDALVQEYIEQPKCIRLIATTKQVLCAYEKVLDGKVVVSIEKGAVRKYFSPSEKLIQFSTLAVRALGGGLMGLDVLERGGVFFALEANVPFGFDEQNNELKTKLLRIINEY